MPPLPRCVAAMVEGAVTQALLSPGLHHWGVDMSVAPRSRIAVWPAVSYTACLLIEQTVERTKLPCHNGKGLDTFTGVLDNSQTSL